MMRVKRVITYGTFDVLHVGHINLLRRASALGNYLIVGLSTDEFNTLKHKEALMPYAERKTILKSLRFVDHVIPERTWEQKRRDIRRFRIDTFVMGSDWRGAFDDLKDICEVVYLERTKHVSSSALKAKGTDRYLRRV